MTSNQLIDEKCLDIALKKHLCSEHKPCRVAAAHLISAYEDAKRAEGWKWCKVTRYTRPIFHAVEDAL